MEDKKTISLKQVFAFVFKHRIIFGVILVALISSFITLSLVFNEQPEAVTVVKSALSGFSEINELAVLEYPYNSYITVYKKDEKGKNIKNEPIYYVAYEGTVKTGFDFNSIIITENPDKKVISIDIPEIEIVSASIDEATLKFLFVDKKYETEDLAPKAISMCKTDLSNKSKGDMGKDFRILSEENAITAIKVLTEPLIKRLPTGYTIEYK